MSPKQDREWFRMRAFMRIAQIEVVGRLMQVGQLDGWDEFQRWEKENVDGSGRVGSSDWPGWERLGVDPKERFTDERKLFQKKQIRQGLRMKVFERDGFKCVECGSQKELTADHINPESKGGEATLENLQTLCRPCNSRKGARING